MKYTKFVRKPFVVEATEVTEDNIDEIAELLGSLRTKDDGTKYIKVNRRLFLNVDLVFPGFWVTKMGDNIRCYSKHVFRKQFVESSPEILVSANDLINSGNGEKDGG